VLDYAIDWAIVQTQKWNTLYILSRERQPPAASINASVNEILRFSSPLNCANISVGLDRSCCEFWLKFVGNFKVRSDWLRQLLKFEIWCITRLLSLIHHALEGTFMCGNDVKMGICQSFLSKRRTIPCVSPSIRLLGKIMD
jgi:hypothetical protein